jgi:hypothetical protein
MAKYRRPVLPADNTYETASTIPAAASFQDVPPPSDETKGVRKAIPIPAMVTMEEIKDTSREAEGKGEEKEKEIFVQGVVIPPKPLPPKDDGMSEILILHDLSILFSKSKGRGLTSRMLHEQLRQLRIQPIRRRP